MKRVGYLFDQVADFHCLHEAMRRAASGRRDKPAVAAFLFHREREIIRLERELREHTYTPGKYITFLVHDPKCRTISAPPFRDRVVHHSLCAAVEPVFERMAIHDSYACRRGKGSHAAVDRAQDYARRYRYFLKLDVEKFFDSVDHEVCRALVRRLVKDPDVLWLVDTVIAHGPAGAPAGKGFPIGNLTSQHLANLYLSGLDHHIKEQLHAKAYLRYMDDMLLFGDDKEMLWRCHEEIVRYLARELKLELQSKATVLAPVSEGVPFLGVRIWPSVRRLTRRRKARFVRKLRASHVLAVSAGGEPGPGVDSVASLVASVETADAKNLRKEVMSQLEKR